MKTTHLNDFITYNVNCNVAIHVDSMITAEVTVYTYVGRKLDGEWCVDCMDSEIDWQLNGKRVKHLGFKELYDKLYGENEYRTLVTNVCSEAEKLAIGRLTTSFSDIIKDEINQKNQ